MMFFARNLLEGQGLSLTVRLTLWLLASQGTRMHLLFPLTLTEGGQIKE